MVSIDLVMFYEFFSETTLVGTDAIGREQEPWTTAPVTD